MNKILVIDDDCELCSLIKKCSKQEGLCADVSYNGIDGLEKLKSKQNNYCLVVLDIMLLEIMYTAFNKENDYKQMVLRLKGIIIDSENRIVTMHEQPIDLTSKEFELLYFLASHKGRIFTKKQIYNEVWKNHYAFDDNNIMSFISKLRKKIEEDSNNPFYIQTVRGVGYRFNKEA